MVYYCFTHITGGPNDWFGHSKWTVSIARITKCFWKIQKKTKKNKVVSNILKPPTSFSFWMRVFPYPPASSWTLSSETSPARCNVWQVWRGFHEPYMVTQNWGINGANKIGRVRTRILPIRCLGPPFKNHMLEKRVARLQLTPIFWEYGYNMIQPSSSLLSPPDSKPPENFEPWPMTSTDLPSTCQSQWKILRKMGWFQQHEPVNWYV